MEDDIDSIKNNKIDMNQICLNKNEKIDFKKIEFTRQFKKINSFQKYPNFINFIFFQIISILLPKTIFSLYMQIKVNEEGYNQIFSNDYKDTLPSKVLINNMPTLLHNKRVYVENITNTIYLEWPNSIRINVSFMFNNLTTIDSVTTNMLPKNGNLSYMFYNCKNLKKFIYNIGYNKANAVKDMRGMFYNCHLIESFDFKNYFIDFISGNTEMSYVYNSVNLSYMFYNCTNLNSINFGSGNIGEINDMRGMFYNCYSLTSLIFLKVLYKNNISVDLSDMFYNCTNLDSFTSNNMSVKDMKYTFYNCSSLTSINLTNFRSFNSLYFINMSNAFYNCYNLRTFIGDFGKIYLNDARELFYNCSSLKTMNFYPIKTYDSINMTRLFYNCTKLNRVNFNYITRSYILPIDLSYAFYNCSSLINLTMNKIKTDKLKEITYMMYNCTKLTNFSIVNSNFTNSIVTNMRGVFQNCAEVTSLNLSTFSTPKVEIMWDMFKGCKKLQKIDQKFNTINVVDMESMFEGCSSLPSLNLNNFRTPKVHYMNKMFSGCKQLKSLYFRSITSQSLGTMHKMFYLCEKLSFLNFFSFTDNDQSIIEIFQNASTTFTFCINESAKAPLIFQEIKNIEGTIRDCSTSCYSKVQVSIPEKKLCCPNVEYNGVCYDKCPPKTSSGPNKKCMNLTCEYYYNFQQNGCLNYIPSGYYLNDSNAKTIDKCPQNCITCEKKSDDEKVHCLTCRSNLPYLYFGDCLKTCPHGSFIDSGIKTCKCVTDKCGDCTEESLKNDLCIKCSSDHYVKSDEKFSKYVKCYKDPLKYYFSSNMYRPCYRSCEQCQRAGNKTHHYCQSCDKNFNFSMVQKISNKITFNCFEQCEFYFYFDNKNDYHCTQEESCPSSYKYLIPEIGQCVQTCDKNPLGYIKKLRYECYKECPKGISKESTKVKNYCEIICPYNAPFILINEQQCVSSCSIMERSQKLCITNNAGNRTNLQIQEIIHDDISTDLSNKFNYSIISDNYSIIIEENETIYEIISSQNKNNKNTLTSNIDFGRCESMLKDYYDIDQNEPLYILKMDAYIEGKIGPTVVYEIFYPIENSINLVQLDISICEGERIGISYTKELENPELYDKNNPIYSDICHPYSSVDGLDMTLSGKQKDYANNNKSLCEENCEYVGYDKEEKLVKCNCDIKDSSVMISDIKTDKDKLYNFMGIDKLANFDVMKCYNLITQKQYLIHNIGFYTFIPTFLCYFISIIFFSCKEFKVTKNEINKLAMAIKKLEDLRERKKQLLDQLNADGYKKPNFLSILKVKKKKLRAKNILTMINKNKISNYKSSSFRLKQNTTEEKKAKGKSLFSKNIKNNKNIINVNNIYNDIVVVKNKSNNAPPLRTQFNINKKFNNNYYNNINIFSKKNKDKFTTDKLNKKIRKSDIRAMLISIEKEENKTRFFLKRNDKELNELNFKMAVKFDKRTFCQFYYCLLKIDHSLIKIFNSKDYNSRTIKIYLFLYNFGLSYAVNGLFFDDEAIEQIFEEGGKFNFLKQIPQILYSTIISLALYVILDYLALPEDSILEIKKETVGKIVDKKSKDLIGILRIKFSFFYFLSFLFMLVCWYYMTCFCAVYRNTQYYLLKDTLISFAVSMLSPFAAKFVPGFLRVYSIKKRSPMFFRMSQFIQMLI